MPKEPIAQSRKAGPDGEPGSGPKEAAERTTTGLERVSLERALNVAERARTLTLEDFIEMLEQNAVERPQGFVMPDPRSSENTFLVGDTRIAFELPLGKGGMAAVWRAAVDGERMAVKLINMTRENRKLEGLLLAFNEALIHKVLSEGRVPGEAAHTMLQKRIYDRLDETILDIEAQASFREVTELITGISDEETQKKLWRAFTCGDLTRQLVLGKAGVPQAPQPADVMTQLVQRNWEKTIREGEVAADEENHVFLREQLADVVAISMSLAESLDADDYDSRRFRALARLVQERQGEEGLLAEEDFVRKEGEEQMNAEDIVMRRHIERTWELEKIGVNPELEMTAQQAYMMVEGIANMRERREFAQGLVRGAEVMAEGKDRSAWVAAVKLLDRYTKEYVRIQRAAAALQRYVDMVARMNEHAEAVAGLAPLQRETLMQGLEHGLPAGLVRKQVLLNQERQEVPGVMPEYRGEQLIRARAFNLKEAVDQVLRAGYSIEQGRTVALDNPVAHKLARMLSQQGIKKSELNSLVLREAFHAIIDGALDRFDSGHLEISRAANVIKENREELMEALQDDAQDIYQFIVYMEDLSGMGGERARSGRAVIGREYVNQVARFACPEQLARIGIGAAAALRKIHKAGIAHGDVKSSNMAFDPEHPMSAVYLDYGLAEQYDPDEGPPARALERVRGTAAHMSPEAWAGRIGDKQKNDVFAYAMMLYEFIVPDAYRDTTGQSLAEVMRNIVRYGNPIGQPEQLAFKVEELRAHGEEIRARLMEVVLQCFVEEAKRPRMEDVERMLIDILATEEDAAGLMLEGTESEGAENELNQARITLEMTPEAVRELAGA